MASTHESWHWSADVRSIVVHLKLARHSAKRSGVIGRFFVRLLAHRIGAIPVYRPL
ncbi:hypothetical protein USDA257_c14030 [Sinorhizobium fredii USDA 257]|uniref:Uncharacterized protein n=1 Tax=Sinorhizobium fredii (strain USDA 257) TaxID=1185652 RepID=I3X287_SINF2|nr:hypothetical protein USDA257_c14030 [Sinorhizobium fredii USDA 257]